MTLKIENLRNPLRAATAVEAWVAARLSARRLAIHGRRRFADDPRFSLQNVTDGFAPRLDQGADTALLERVCTAYIKAVEQEPVTPGPYSATNWWEQVRQGNLGPVIHALRNRDIEALRGAYRNFFRDPCSTGLIGVPYGMSRPYSNIRETHRRLYLIDVLYRIDHWMAQTGGQFHWRDLAGPGIGNPFGVVIAGTLIEAGAEHRHYCAHRIKGFINSDRATVAEIGGGFGGMAYYLLRDQPGVTYLDFDVPESLALASYYLMRAFPHLTFLLHGERGLTKEAIASADVVLMPLPQLVAMPSESTDITFSSHAISALSRESMSEYLKQIARISNCCFLNIGKSSAAFELSELAERGHETLSLTEKRESKWNSHKMPGSSEIESLYHIGGH